MTSRYPVIVIGGGISGLACAHALRESGIDAQVFESSPRAGGVIRSERRDGFLLELGPQSFSATAPLLSLIDGLGIRNQAVEALRRASRFVVVGGALREVPLSPPGFFASGLFGVRTKASVLGDLLGSSQPPEPDESVADFVRRKFSAELLDRLVGPFVSGIYAGDPERLSLRACFPQLYAAEKASRSVIRGMLRGAKKQEGPRQRPTLLSFREGNETLIQSLAEKLGTALHCNCKVTGLQKSGPARFTIHIEANGSRESLETEHVVVATPSAAAAKLVWELHPGFEAGLAAIEYAPVAVVSTGYHKSSLRQGLGGFGFLIPRSAGLRTLGTVWNSSLFPGRSPADHVLLTSFAGGATDPEAIAAAPLNLVNLVHHEISPLLGLQQPPAFSNVQIYAKAIPQYNLGHQERLAALEAGRRQFPGLHFAGSYWRGPAIGGCVEQALAVAEEIRIECKR